jgi:Leucine-rich repeat (LRR) protein
MALTNLHCGGSVVSDLSPLRGMPLTTLFVNNSQVADLSPLQDCKQLKTLNVAKTQVTPAMIAALQQVLPNCKIQVGP